MYLQMAVRMWENGAQQGKSFNINEALFSLKCFLILHLNILKYLA